MAPLFIISFLSFIGLLWAAAGFVWTPLAQVSWVLQKMGGFSAILFLIIFVFSPSVRKKCRLLWGRLQTAPLAEHKIFIFSFFFISGCLLSFAALYRHNSLQSGTFDLGILLNATWNFAHGNGFYDPVLNLQSYLGDHWQPILVLYAPFFRFFTSAAPFLMSQGFAIAVGAYGLYKIGIHLTGRRDWSVFCAILFLLHRDIHKINRFHFHPEVLGFIFLIWAIYFIIKERFLLAFLLVVFCWFLKEDFPVNTFAVGVVSFWISKNWRFGTGVMASSVLMFYLIIGIFMPHFLGSEMPTHLVRYNNLGNTPATIIITLILSPHHVLKDILTDPWFWNVPIRYLVPFFLLPFLSPPFLVASLISWLPHLLSDHPPQRSLQCQYGVPVLCFLAVGALFSLSRLLKTPERFYGIGTKMMTIGPTPFVLIMIAVFSFGVPRYFRPVDADRVHTFHSLISSIPVEASVIAQDNLGPHLAYRKVLKVFPNRFEGDYIVLDKMGNKWPMSDETYSANLNHIMATDHYEVIKEEGGFVIFKRKS